MTQSRSAPRRQGVILLLVVIMLALFLVVGLSFMLYAESEATASRIYREAFTVNYDRADIDTGALMNYALGQLIYDVKDDIDGCDSSMRGHSFARNMYGWQDPATTATSLVNRNTVAFNGIGRLPTSTFNQNPPALGTTDAVSMINYRFFQSDGFVRDPERLGFRANPLVPITQATQPYGGGWNVPYTFPDRNNVYLAALKANDSGSPRVRVQSFHRPEGTPFETANLTDYSAANPWLTPSSTNPALKYMVMRPRPADMYWNGPNDPHSFPLPASPTGDVQNLPGGAGGNDSFWMDLGYPVQTTRGGTKFKPLFAFLIVDLDGRVNLNVHGNQRGTNGGTPTHVSNQGVGKWEVNLGKVINVDPNELKTIFGDPSNAAIVGRYGPNRVVGGSSSTAQVRPYPDFPTTMLRPSMMRMDFDGVDGTSNAATTRLTMPGAHQTQPAFSTGYDSLMEVSTVREKNPFNYNILSANPAIAPVARQNVDNFPYDDKPFDLNQNLYYVIGDALSQNQQRAALFSNGLRNNLNSARVRHMLTTMSFDLDTPGARPWVTNPQDPATAYTLPTPTDVNDPTQYHAKGAMTGYTASTNTAPSNINTGSIVGSDFLPNDGRCRVLPRVDLNRKLTPYPVDAASYVNPGPPPGAGTVPDAIGQPYYRALWDRQKFAAEIFDRLVLVTGAIPFSATVTPTPEQTNARRYLAQLAVNIVDYIDDDEISTPFYWDGYDPNAVVYGVEAPKLVLNEVYAEIRNDKQDDGQQFASHDFKVHFWVELFNPRMKAIGPDNNPMMDLIYPTDNRADVQLTNFQNHPVYRIRVMEEAATFVPTDLRALNNVTGDSTPANPVAGLTEKVIAKQWDLTASTVPLPANERTRVRAIDPMSPNFPNGVPGVPGTSPGSNTNGYYVVASENDVESLMPAQEPSNRLQTDETNRLGLARSVTNGTTVPAQPNHTVLLQRLACPHLRYNPPAPDPEHNPDPNVPLNPYVTVDYVTNLKTYDAVKALQFPATRMMGAGDPPASRRSRARVQPLAAAQLAMSPAPQYSFFNPNSAASQYDWLVHLDRPPVSIMEMLQVSAFKSHEITQTFTDQAGNKFQHVAPWLGLATEPPPPQPRAGITRLFRALEYFTVGDRSAWAPFPGLVATVQPSVGGRVPGRININTMWDHETLDAQTDPQPVNFFLQTDVDNSWNAIQQRRTARLGGAGANNSPFLGFANPAENPKLGNFPTTPGLDGTVLANNVFPGPASATHPYLKDEMLTKMANSMTTRSNVFAVYLTVGFFEVLDDTTRPVKLGAEVRPRSGVPIRHKMFAIVDRTHLATAGTPFDATNTPNAGTAQGGTENGVRKSQFFVTADQVDTEVAVIASVRGVTAEILGQPVNVTVVGGLSATTMIYDGKAIPLPASFTMYADVGENQEVLTDCRINAATGQLFVPNGFRKTHPANFTLSFLLPSNPGPQTNGIDYTDPTYSGVIPQAVIIQ